MRRTLGEVTCDAGDFDEWADQMVAALDGGGDADVPCGECTACCTASQFVHIGPDETAALAHIPGQLLFPAPGRPPGHVLMGYDQHGRCPMFADGGCSIYANRPRTCRTYDCRIFPATGVGLVGEPSKADIARRAGEWEFRFSGVDAEVRQQAMRAAAHFVADHAAELFDDADGPPPTQRAVLAVELHRLFLDRDPSRNEPTATSEPTAMSEPTVIEPSLEAVAVELSRRRPSGTR